MNQPSRISSPRRVMASATSAEKIFMDKADYPERDARGKSILTRGHVDMVTRGQEASLPLSLSSIFHHFILHRG
jgi:hypothetical protein